MPALVLCLSVAVFSFSAQAQNGSPTGQATSTAATAKAVGTIKALAGSTVTLAADTGSEVAIQVQESTRIVRLAPGQKDLKDATPIQLQDLQVGDRMLARGVASADGKALTAASIIVMTRADLAAKQQQDREDWQRRGVGGLVKSVDPAAGDITISVPAGAQSKNLAIHVTNNTIIRRYAPDSVKFDDAKPGTLAEIKPGDQLRARGTRSDDGSRLTADEIVSGTFRNIAGTVISTDAASRSVKVADLLSKKPLTVKVASDSQLRKLPPFVAQRIAMRLKGGGEAAGAPGAGSPAGGASAGVAPNAAPAAANAGPRRSGGPPDFQQMLARLPAVTLSDLQKGDAVMIVTTEGSANSEPTVITLLSGVETILTAAPNSSAAQLLSPWNIGGGAGAESAEGATP